MRESDVTTPRPALTRPGWLELAVAIVSAVVLYLGLSLAAEMLPGDSPLSPGHAAFLVAALAPTGAVLIALAVRIRDPRALGFRAVRPAWLLIAVGLGVACFLLSWPASWLLDPLFPPSESVQASYRDASQAGALSLVLSLLLGGVLTPIGEELLFRGVVARFLLRWGPWVGIVASALVFALAHGINTVLPVALVAGLLTGFAMHATGSIWPGIIIHVVHNSSGIVYHSFG